MLKMSLRKFVADNESFDCVLMFSGGRDSTIAAKRLLSKGKRVALITVTSGHLFGLKAVYQRLTELSEHAERQTLWMAVEQPINLLTDTSFYKQTCLPCHHAYVVVACAIAKIAKCPELAFGYTKYQSDWPEQTPLAIDALSSTLGEYDIRLNLPVADLASRDDAIRFLDDYGLSPDALEQKCIRQITNVRLNDVALRQQVSLWQKAIKESLEQIDTIDLDLVDKRHISRGS